MEFTAKQKVAQYLGYTSEVRFQKLTVKEWAKVYWVHIEGRRPTMLSKKKVDRASQIRLNYTICGTAIALDENTGKYYAIKDLGFEFAIKEIAKSEATIWFDFSASRIQSLHVKYTENPSTVREMLVLKAIKSR